MKTITNFILLICLVFASSPAALGADIRVSSKIDAVTVYRSGAEVVRLVKQKIEAGAHTLIVADLPAEAVLNSIRVEGRADGDLLLGSVDSRRVFILEGERARQGEPAQSARKRT